MIIQAFKVESRACANSSPITDVCAYVTLQTYRVGIGYNLYILFKVILFIFHQGSFTIFVQCSFSFYAMYNDVAHACVPSYTSLLINLGSVWQVTT